MMLASRTGFADTLALDYARELQIGGQVFRGLVTLMEGATTLPSSIP